MTTPRDAVKQAVNKAFDMVNSLDAADTAIQEAKHAEDVLRNEARLEAIEAQAKLELEAAVQEAADTYETAVAVARKPMERAQAVFEAKRTAAAEQQRTATDGVSAVWEKKIEKCKQEEQMKAAEARAAVHSAQQNKANIQANIDRLWSHTQQQLGVDLKGLLKLV